MLKSTYVLIAVMVASALAACNSNGNSPFRKPMSGPVGAPINNTPVGVTANATPAASAPSSKSPYVLTANSNGPIIDFSIYNMGSTDLQVDAKDFAVISVNAREVTPFDKSNAVIDLPQPAVVKPNQTLTGRAIFNNIATPVGYRLVYKPDTTGTFADIHPAHSKRS